MSDETRMIFEKKILYLTVHFTIYWLVNKIRMEKSQFYTKKKLTVNKYQSIKAFNNTNKHRLSALFLLICIKSIYFRSAESGSIFTL